MYDFVWLDTNEGFFYDVYGTRILDTSGFTDNTLIWDYTTNVQIATGGTIDTTNPPGSGGGGIWNDILQTFKITAPYIFGTPKKTGGGVVLQPPSNTNLYLIGGAALIGVLLLRKK